MSSFLASGIYDASWPPTLPTITAHELASRSTKDAPDSRPIAPPGSGMIAQSRKSAPSLRAPGGVVHRRRPPRAPTASNSPSSAYRSPLDFGSGLSVPSPTVEECRSRHIPTSSQVHCLVYVEGGSDTPGRAVELLSKHSLRQLGLVASPSRRRLSAPTGLSPGLSCQEADDASDVLLVIVRIRVVLGVTEHLEGREELG